MVSHDRYFLNKLPTRIFELGREGITAFLGTYNYYVEKKQEIESGKKYLEELAGKEEKTQEEKLSVNEQRRLKKEEEARKRRLARQLAQAEENIESLESRIASIEAQLCREEVMTDPEQLKNFSKELDEAKEEMAGEYERWIELQDI